MLYEYVFLYLAVFFFIPQQIDGRVLAYYFFSLSQCKTSGADPEGGGGGEETKMGGGAVNFCCCWKNCIIISIYFINVSEHKTLSLFFSTSFFVFYYIFFNILNSKGELHPSHPPPSTLHRIRQCLSRFTNVF